MAGRLSRVMNEIISKSQTTFVKGRNLVDGAMIINEVMDLAKKRNLECLVFKVDFEKFYDSVDGFFGVYDEEDGFV